MAWAICATYKQMQKLLSNKPPLWEAEIAHDLLKHSRLDDGFFVTHQSQARANAEIDADIAEFKRQKPH